MAKSYIHDSRGALLDVGASAIVELLSNGVQVVKSPFPGEEHQQCQQDMRIEAEVYRKLEALGADTHFLRLISFDEENLTITLPYMSIGTLRSYLKTQAENIKLEQRLKWCVEAAEGLETLHAINVKHCDFSPKNMLLDADMTVKIADFGCSSVDGKASTGMGDVRFYPSIDQSDLLASDIFALGSTMFEILTGTAPFHDVSSRSAGELLCQHQFPSLEAVELRDAILKCWARQYVEVGVVRREVAAAVDAWRKG